jgi:hypothetical protein
MAFDPQARARNAYPLGVDKDAPKPHFEMENWWTAVDGRQKYKHSVKVDVE